MLEVVTSSFYTQSQTMTPPLNCNCNDMTRSGCRPLSKQSQTYIPF